MSRTLIATFAGLAGFVAYVAVVVALGDHVRDLPWFVELVYFGVAGFAWTWPALRLIGWAARDPRRVAAPQPD